jgi:hypothetical protein
VIVPSSLMLMPLNAVVVSETSFTWFPDIDAPPKSVPVTAPADGTKATMARVAKSVMNRFIWSYSPFDHFNK